MRKRYALLSLVAIALMVSFGFSAVGSNDQLLVFACGGGVVDKTPGEDFTVKITFKNTGESEGVWSVNIAFEGESWSWSGTAQKLTLKPCHKKTLTWKGSVPEDASIDSMARLIVYYNDSFQPLNWWIHVINEAELTITSSTVK